MDQGGSACDFKSFKKIRITKPKVQLKMDLNKLFEKKENIKISISKTDSNNTNQIDQLKVKLKDVENEIKMLKGIIIS